MIHEDAVVLAMVDFLEEEGWTIESYCLGSQPGYDIVARDQHGARLFIEAKGEGSGKRHTARFGKAFSKGQISTHLAVAVHASLKVLAQELGKPGLALPDTGHHRAGISELKPVLRQLGIDVYWVRRAASALSVEQDRDLR